MLVSTVELYWRARKSGGLGITGVEALGLDWGAIVERKDRLVASWSKGKDRSLEKEGIAVLRGQARFLGPRRLRVGEQTVTAEKVVIATGSAPRRPPIAGVERAITSDELIHLKTLPRRMVVVGGGLIGMEFGFCFARAGTRVTVLQAGPQVLPGVDDEMREVLLTIGREAGMDFRINVQVARIAEDRVVEAEVNGTPERFPADVVLLATGRPPNVGGLNLEAAGVELERGGVKVNEYLQSPTAPDVYAAGDATGRHQHTPVAWYEGAIAAENALKGNRKAVDYRFLPTAVFTIPALAQVGLTEREARASHPRVGVNRAPLKHNPAAGVRDEAEGLVKVIHEEASGRLLGVHVLGAGAEDLIEIAAAAMRGGLTRAEVGAMHYVFPTLGGAIFDAMAGG